MHVFCLGLAKNFDNLPSSAILSLGPGRQVSGGMKAVPQHSVPCRLALGLCPALLRAMRVEEAGIATRGSCQPLVWRAAWDFLRAQASWRLGSVASSGALVRRAAVPSPLDVCPCDCRHQQLGLFVISVILWFRIWW